MSLARIRCTEDVVAAITLGLAELFESWLRRYDRCEESDGGREKGAVVLAPSEAP